MRKRKLYLSELIERHYNTTTVKVMIFFPKAPECTFENFNDVKNKLKESIYIWEVKKWTYSQVLGFIIILK